MDSTSFWNNAATKYAKSSIGNMDAYQQSLALIRARLKPHHNVLELGCGTGSTALELAEEVSRYHGTDFSKRMIQIACEKRNRSFNMHLEFSVAEAADLPSGSFDVVLALNVFHLLPDLETVLREVFEALPPGGLLIAKTTLLRKSPWYVRTLIRLMEAVGKAPFVQFLCEVDVRNMYKKQGFIEIETLVQIDTAPRLFSVVKKP